MAEWDLEKYYWPKERVERWWGEDWDWDNLLTKPCPHLDFKTYAEYYGEAFSKTIRFDDPRPGKTGQISEWEYWHLDGKDRWLTEFAGKLWTPYHLPLYNPHTLELSPKHPDYKGANAWTETDFLALHCSLITRIVAGAKRGLTPLSGIVIPSDIKLPERNELFYTDFSNTLWRQKADFSGTIFGAWTNFSGATFSDDAEFSNASFCDRADFTDAMFGIEAKFFNVTFRKLTIFTKATFNDEADFTNAVFSNGIDLTKATFHDVAKFSHSQFSGDTDFQGTTFHGLAKFYDAELSEETYFTLKNSNWGLPQNRLGIFLALQKGWIFLCQRITWLKRKHLGEKCAQAIRAHDDRCSEFEKAFRVIKAHMKKTNTSETVYFFGALETRSRIRMSTCTIPEKWLSSCYTAFSNYGQSFWRPLFWLLVSFLIATAVTCCAALPFWQDFAPDNLGFAATAAWHNLVPGGFIKDVFQGCHDEACRSYHYGEWSDHLLTRYGFWLYVVTGLFAAFNLALWFLFGLALKRRFQIK